MSEVQKLQDDLKQANWYYDYFLEQVQKNELQLRAMRLLIKELEAKIALISNGKNEIVEE
jgi:hypothetical protein